MIRTFDRRLAVALLLIAEGTAGCGSSSMAGSTVAPTAVALSVTSLSPNIGSTGGATEVKIAGLALGATVTFDGIPVQGHFFAGNPTMYLSTPAHAAGTVDVVVRGQGGQSVSLANAYTYTSPLTFDFNGSWVGVGATDQDGLVAFTIRDNLLRSVSCGPDVTVTLSPPRPVTDGQFAFVRDDGVSVSGRIVADSSATGSIKLGSCESGAWRARKE